MNAKVKVLSFCFAALASNRAQAADFFCEGVYPNHGTYVVAKQQAYPSRVPVSQVVVIDGYTTLDLKGTYELPQSDVFGTHSFKLNNAGQEATLTISLKIEPIGCTRAGCDHIGPGRTMQPKFPSNWEPSKNKLDGVLVLGGETTEFTCETI